MKLFTTVSRRTAPGPAPAGRRAPSPHSHRTVPRVAETLAGTRLQPSLPMGTPGDRFEREADSVAEAVMRMPESATASPSPPPAAGAPPPPKPPSSGARPSSLLAGSAGRPLAASARAFFEPRFGADFSGVRVHHDEAAGELARDLHARAFAVGPDLVFAPGQFAPETTRGRHLLAHELTHVLQQGRAPTLRRCPCRGSDETFPPLGEWNEPERRLEIRALTGGDRIQREDDESPPAAPSPAEPAQEAPAEPTEENPAPAAPSLTFAPPGATLARGQTLDATVAFHPTAGETLQVRGWKYTTAEHGEVTRPAADSGFQDGWSGVMAVSGTLEMTYTVTPDGGNAGEEQSLTQEITVNDRAGSDWESSVTAEAEEAFAGQPSPPTRFSHLGYHNARIRQPNPTTTNLDTGPNRQFRFVESIAAGTYTSTPQIHPDLTDPTSAFRTFHQDGSVLLHVVGSVRTRIPVGDYSNLAINGSLTFEVPDWEAFFKTHGVVRVRASRADGSRTVSLSDAQWGLDGNARNAAVEITDEGAVRQALGDDPATPYDGAISVAVSHNGSFEGSPLMPDAAILAGTQSHEYAHGTHSHRANFVKMVRAVDPRRVLEKTVSAPGHAVNFNNKLTTLKNAILAPDHEIVDETESRAAEAFVAMPGEEMAGVNTDPDTGDSLGAVWNIPSNRAMTN
jgi:hypothetical protein